jgi:aryl-alcohol dehydrogenase-like predicted oxidoreductase
MTSPLGLGGAQFGGMFAAGDRRAWLRLIHAAMDGGISFFDTADFYTQGESERLIGEAVGLRRPDVVIATKFGYCLPAQKRFGGRLKPLLRPLLRRLRARRAWASPAMAGRLSQNFSPAYIPHAVEQSLTRLRTDYIDLLQLHSPPASVIQAGDWIEPLERLQQAGKIRSYGVSCEESADGLVALKHSELSAVQVSVNLLEREPPGALVSAAHAGQVAIIARQPFAAGFLTRELETLDSLKMGDLTWPAERARIASFHRIARREGFSPSELALSYVRGVPGVSVVLMSVSSEKQLTENIRCFHEPRIPDSLLAEVQSIFDEPLELALV